MPYLSVAKRGYTLKFDLLEVVTPILYKLKSGCQWRLFQIRHLFSGYDLPCHQTAFHHYRKWCKTGEWQKIHSKLLKEYRSVLDLSLTHIDGSYTPAYCGGKKIEYQGHKKRPPTNALFFSDNQGIHHGMSEPQSGNHMALYGIEESVEEMMTHMDNAGISVEILFCDIDTVFDGKGLCRALDSRGIVSNVLSKPPYQRRAN